MGKIYVVGLGPGEASFLTGRAREVIAESDVIVGYKTYTDIVKKYYPEKEYSISGMKQEYERCARCVAYAREGKTVALVSSGDPGIYGMASPMLEVAQKEGFAEVEIIPGITAACSGAAVLGAPVSHDLCIISLSDLLTPWNLIEKRLKAAAEGDFCIVLYNPASHKRADYLKRACEILMSVCSPDTVCGFVRNIGREGTECKICTLRELADEKADMFVTVFIGNSMTKSVNGKMITPRGYELK